MTRIGSDGGYLARIFFMVNLPVARSRVAGWALLPTSPLRTVREHFLFIPLKPPPGAFLHPVSLGLTSGDAPVCDSWDAVRAGWKDCPCRRRPGRECDGHAIHSLW